MWRIVVFLLLVCTLNVPMLMAADSGGRFMIKGAGLASCQRFVEAIENRDRESLSYGGWIEGYLTAVNQLHDNTFDIAPWQSADYFARVVYNYCQKSPKVSFFKAMSETVQALERQRLTQHSAMIKISNGQTDYLIHQEVLLQVQQRLEQLGLSNEAADGIYDQDLQRQLETYQRKSSLPETGIPDQSTLAKLFYDTD